MIDIFFDKVYIISYIKNVYKQKKQLYLLDKIGFKNVEIKYSINIPDTIIKDPGNLLNIKDVCASFTHYNTIKEAYELGYNKILIIEDDCIWMKDIEKIHNYIIKNESDKNNYDLIFYSYILENNVDKSGISIGCQNCYSLSRAGMKFYIDNYEHFPYIIDSYIKISNEEQYYHQLIYDYYVIYPMKLNYTFELEIVNKDIKYSLCEEQICLQSFHKENVINDINNIIDNTFLNKFIKHININDYNFI